MKAIKVLFVCVHNSARSQMAEALLNHLGAGRFQAQSAGLEPGSLNPLVVRAMAEAGIDISNNRTKSVKDIIARRHEFDYVITLCDEASAERCPVFPGGGKRLHWAFADPSSLKGTEAEKLEATRQIRDQIRQQLEQWLKAAQ